MWFFTRALAAGGALSLAAALPSPFPPALSRSIAPRATNVSRAVNVPALNMDFPDPSIMRAADGTWYAFATNNYGKQVQVATAPAASGPLGAWTWAQGADALPVPGRWTTGANTWAPDARPLDDGSYVLYYSGQVAASPDFHCVGTATARTPAGPYVAAAEPFACDLAAGGAIDPSGFRDDADGGARYVVYKVDGNGVGHGGDCGNSVAPVQATPLVLQRVGADGVTKVGAAVTILDRTDADGPLVEAPALMRHPASGLYVLFYSSGCWSGPSYAVKYATAPSVRGPYTRGAAPLLRTGDAAGLTSPGGATPTADGAEIVFHANCPAGRCLFRAAIDVVGMTVVLKSVGGIGS